MLVRLLSGCKLWRLSRRRLGVSWRSIRVYCMVLLKFLGFKI